MGWPDCLFDFRLGLGILGPMKLKEMAQWPFYQQSGNVNCIPVPVFLSYYNVTLKTLDIYQFGP